MTTIAEKIKEIDMQMEYLERGHEIAINRLRTDLKKLKAEVLPPDSLDPEPLECWVCLNQDGIIVRAQFAKPDNRCWRKVRMREVTPQMLEDEKDARRFRRLMEMDGVGWQEGGEGWTALIPGRTLREAVDKEMEDK